MDFSHPCDKIANAPRRIKMSKCKFTYENSSYHILLKKVKTHNEIKIFFGDLYLNGELSKQIVIKVYEPLSPDLFDLDLYTGLVEEIEIHTMIESKIGYSNYYSHMLFHFWTETCVGIIYDYFGTTLCTTDLLNYSLKDKTQMILQLINQINFLQQNDIYHGDLKPQNICITPNGEIVLIDFGIGYLKEFYCDFKLKTKYNTTITSGSPEYISIYLDYCAGKEYPKELFDKSQHFAIGGLIFGILINNPGLYFIKSFNIINSLKNKNENLENLNLANRFKYFNEDFCKIICDFISKELDKNTELNSFIPIILNMFEYDYKKRLNFEEIIKQIEKIEL
jgi:serine/threonine protein kinase